MHGVVVPGIVVVHINILPLGRHRGLHRQAGRVVVLVPCTDALHRRDDKHHDHNAEYQKKHDIEHAESHSKSHIKPHHRVSPFIGQMCFLFFLFYPIAAEMSINFRLRGEKYPAT